MSGRVKCFGGYDDACADAIRAVYWQDIIDRRGAKIGIECLIRLAGVTDRDTRAAISWLPSLMLCRITSKLLHRISLSCVRSPYANRGRPFKIFLNIEKQTLSCVSIVDELIEASRCLTIAGYELVVEVTERQLPSDASFRLYIDGLVRLKQANIFVILDDDSQMKDEEHVELELGLAHLVKFDINSLGIPHDPFSSNFFGETFRRLQGRLYDFIDLYQVFLLAEKVETLWQSRVVTDLPFSYFQGYHYGRPYPAEDGLMPALDYTPIEALPRQGRWIDVEV